MKDRILDISYKERLSHIGSNLSMATILDTIYEVRKPDEPVVVSNGHAHLAHLVAMEKYGIIPCAYEALKAYGIHCDVAAGCDVSTGSLGQGLPIAVGMALADRSKRVFCTVSDGEMAEGSIWEALRIGHANHLENLRIVLNYNGYGAYGTVDKNLLKQTFMGMGIPMYCANADDKEKIAFGLGLRLGRPGITFVTTDTKDYPENMQGLQAHYHVMSQEDYERTTTKA